MKYVYSDLGLIIYFALTFIWFQQISNAYLVFLSYFSSLMIKSLVNFFFTKEMPCHPWSIQEKSCLCRQTISEKDLWKIKIDIHKGTLLESNISLPELIDALGLDYGHEKSAEANETFLLENLLQKINFHKKILHEFPKKSSSEEINSLLEFMRFLKSFNDHDKPSKNFMEIGIIENRYDDIIKIFTRQNEKDSSHFEMIFLPKIGQCFQYKKDFAQKRKKLSKITNELANIITIINTSCTVFENGFLKQNEIGLNTVHSSQLKFENRLSDRPGECPRIDLEHCVDPMESIKHLRGLSSLLFYQIENLKISDLPESNLSNQSAHVSRWEFIAALDFCLELFKIKQKYDLDKNNLELISKYECHAGINIRISDKMLKQIVIILLLNAYQFSVSGQIVLEVTELEEEKKLRISVSDNGCGISPVEQKTLLKSINSSQKNEVIKVDDPLTSLSVANEFLVQMGSNLEFTSKINEGSKFWFDLNYVNNCKINLINSPLSVKNEINSQETHSKIILPQNEIQIIKPFTRILKEASFNGSRSSLGKENSQKILSSRKNLKNNFEIQSKNLESNLNSNNKIISSKFLNLEKSKSLKNKNRNILFLEFQDDKEIEEDYIIEYIKSKKRKNSACEFKGPKLNPTFILDSADEISHSNLSRKELFEESKENNAADYFYNHIYIDYPAELQTVLNIIVCEEEKTILQATSNIIRRVTKSNNVDVNIITCSNGIECLNAVYEAYVRKLYIDFIFVDENIPFIRGSLVTNLVKTVIQEKQIKDIIVYVVTTYEDDDNVRLIKSRGCNGVIQKPITATVLRDILI